MIYLDYNATTPIAPEVLEEMLPYLKEHFGNPSSSHPVGKVAQAGVEVARGRLAGLLSCQPDEVYFTGGGSESNNQVIKGIAESFAERGKHIITSAVEHPAVIQPCRWLQAKGFDVSYAGVDEFGRVSVDAIRNAIREETILITIMHANNETGSLQPISEIAELAKERGILFHTDAAQSVGKISTRVDELGVDFLSIAGHKLYAPKGIGALYVRSGVHLPSLIHGAGHERGMRAGTENVPHIAGLGKAAEIALGQLTHFSGRVRKLRDKLFDLLAQGFESTFLNGHPEHRLPNTLNVSLEGVDSRALLESIPDLAASTGSACHSGEHEPSAVLTAMGLSRKRAIGAIRLSLGRGTTESEIEDTARMILKATKGAAH
ncbi:MAG: cysteine desulfurase family protein [Planctomycetota bacterium]|nr:cysteine desulfurase family protein [Planctomycetota bacterium]MDA1142535.1 cysteine desulfurase family protein [Planctomycetota bacterium]